MRDRLRVAVIAACPFPAARGTPIRIRRLAEGIAARGHEVHVVTYAIGEADPPALRVHRIHGFRFYRKTSPGPTPAKLLLLDPALARLAGRVFDEAAIDIVHAHHYEGLLASVFPARKRGIPIVYDAHTTLASELPYYLPRPLGRGARAIGRWIDARLPRAADHVIAVAPRVGDTLEREARIAGEKITIIPNGVETALFARASEEAGCRAPSGRLVFTGNLAPYQRIDLLLQAFAKIAAARPDVRLLLAIDSSFDSEAPLAASLGIRDRIDVRRVAFDEVPALLAGSDVALNPRTECEGIPQKVLNYLAAARPVVSFAGSAVSIRHEREGLVVPNGDTAAFASAVVRLLDDPSLARRLGDAGAARAAEHSWESRAAETERVFFEVLSRRGKA
ncbi:MAG: glycosyltransferase family 1 protein [Candidatus Latescibacterota bacterium]|nr:MAG: glycosyltransferase family 1 protein [Candidatus Latescibacterota bacterium]